MIQPRRNLIALVAILLILTAVCRVPIIAEVRVSFQLLFQISVSILLAYGIWCAGNKWLSGLLLLATVSCFYPKLTTNSFLTFQLIVFGAVWYLILVYSLKSKWKNILLDAMCIIALCNVGYMICQGLGFDPIYRDIGGATKTQSVGFMANRNEIGALLAFCLPAFFRGYWQLAIPVLIIGFALTYSMGGVLSAGTVIIVFLCWYLKRWMAVTGVIACLTAISLYAIYLDPHFDLSRLTAWGLMWDLYKHNWISGFGLGSFQTIFMGLKDHFVTPFGQAHNDLFQGVFEMGIGFAILTTGYFVSIIRRINKKAILSLAAITGIIVNSLVNFPFHVAITAMIAITWMAILEVELRDDRFSKKA